MTAETPDEDLNISADSLVSRMRLDGWARLTGQQVQRALDELQEVTTVCDAVIRAAKILTVLRDTAQHFERIQEQQWEHYKTVKAEGYPEEMAKQQEARP